MRVTVQEEGSNVPFEVFNKRASTSSKTPMVTVQKGGGLSLNKAAYEVMGEPQAVELLYDKEEQLIGFRPVSPDTPLAFPVQLQGKNATGRQVTGRAFTKYYDIDTSVARRYVVKMRDGILVLDLKSKSVEVTGPRATMKSRLGAGL